jgi:hypothetical protein
MEIIMNTRVPVCAMLLLVIASYNPVNALAQALNQFQNGAIADAAAINENFESLKILIEDLEIDSTSGLIVAEGQPSSLTGNEGDLYLDHTSGLLYGPKGFSGWGSPVSLVNPVQGVQGEQGLIGLTGSQGDVGPQGDQGLIGLTGPQGDQGPAGSTGAQGDLGAQGPQGLIGSQGLKGDTGTQGLPGIQGPGGSTGANGVLSFHYTINTCSEFGSPGVGDIQFDDASQCGRVGSAITGFVLSAVDANGLSLDYLLYLESQKTGYIRASRISNLEESFVVGFDDFSVTPTGDWFFSSGQSVVASAKFLDSLDGSGLYDNEDLLITFLFDGLGGLAGPPGEVGPQGPRGDVGPQGDQGLIGSTGLQGEVGPQGPQGDLGPQGDQGLIGLTGLQGEVGPQGPQGDVGPQGDQGLIGLTGLQGEVGPQGAQGDVGPQGDQGLIGLTGLQGEVGPQGTQGDVGPQGDQGLIGLTGPQGEVGPQGPQGDVGPQGLIGLIGLTGLQGEVGPQGPQGDVGPQGDQGLIGLTGLQGEVGPQGTQGDVGPQGLIGLTGPQGDTGLNGAQCSAVQNGSNVTFTCGDGSSATIAGYGTVLVIPEGTAGTDPGTGNFNVGDIVVKDGGDTIISDNIFFDSSQDRYLLKSGDGKVVTAFNDHGNQGIVFRGDNNGIYYQEADCAGMGGLARSSSELDYDPEIDSWISSGVEVGTIIARSKRRLSRVDDNHSVDPATFTFVDMTACENIDVEILQVYTIVPYTLPSSWLNAVYPLRIEQLP